MSDRLSLGPIQVVGNSPFEINDAFRQVSERLDELKGLRGRGMIFDRVRVDDPAVSSDAMTLGSFSESVDVFVTLVTVQTITAAKTFSGTVTFGSTTTFQNTVTLSQASLRYADSNGTVLHSFGSST